MVAAVVVEAMAEMVEMVALAHTFLAKLLTMALMVAAVVMVAMVEVATVLNRLVVVAVVTAVMLQVQVVAVMELPTMVREEMVNMVAKQVNPVSA